MTVAVVWDQFPADKAAVVPLSTRDLQPRAPVMPLFPFVPPAWEGWKLPVTGLSVGCLAFVSPGWLLGPSITFITNF